MRTRHRTLVLTAVITAMLVAAILLGVSTSHTLDGPQDSHPVAATAIEYAL